MDKGTPYILDNDRYYLMGRVEAKGLPVVLQCSNGLPVHYCIQYAGNGHYFDTLAEALLYMNKRWGFSIVGKPQAVWVDDGKNPPIWISEGRR